MRDHAQCQVFGDPRYKKIPEAGSGILFADVKKRA